MTSVSLESNHTAGRVLVREPLVTISRRSKPWPLGLLSVCPESLLKRPGLHLLTPSWWINQAAATEIAQAWHCVQQHCPQVHMVVLANDEDEAYWLQQAGIQAFVISELCFVDERPFQLRTTETVEFDAIYNAALAPYKRHLLAKEVERLLLVYRYDLPDVLQAAYEGLLPQLPQAVFYNHAAGAGQHRQLNPEDVASQYRRAAVGLALSAVEGAMKAAVEYLFAGLPVVTTTNRGGRDRLLRAPYARHCAASSGEVAKAVEHQMREAPPAAEIRRYASTVINHERRALERLLATLVWELFRTELPAASFGQRFFGSVAFKPYPVVRAEVEAVLLSPQFL